ncbi:hypothetical protein CEXT_333401 [Caerostris extrusa]|uniref:Uncharacterized protein n=1 Tax=Caerostris extrusa TaxID=172846 RepID=A0AAV4NDX2_CAEEX|nr:hypothetical protein CEXT_333401 [Caerostris extrusa]
MIVKIARCRTFRIFTTGSCKCLKYISLSFDLELCLSLSSLPLFENKSGVEERSRSKPLNAAYGIIIKDTVLPVGVQNNEGKVGRRSSKGWRRCRLCCNYFLPPTTSGMRVWDISSLLRLMLITGLCFALTVARYVLL